MVQTFGAIAAFTVAQMSRIRAQSWFDLNDASVKTALVYSFVSFIRHALTWNSMFFCRSG